MGEKIIDIENRYVMEIDRIKYILSSLENGRIYEKTGVQSDGYLNTNVSKLKKELNELFNKIQYGKESDLDRMGDFF
ncbi:hypothetical protein [Sporosarcina sp. 6E9]|uniref:hypothetical protein n=1 Tax=Sporosarcina sp. 6E9 TaxID=2819235 RepID=UPI001ACBEBCA|nr:hypothetical protein [Sporosarcina sp. 6E9]MBO1909765.1 hypothetical protein [Microvirga sp. 3-52]